MQNFNPTFATAELFKYNLSSFISIVFKAASSFLTPQMGLSWISEDFFIKKSTCDYIQTF